jgi:hypothetical protein
MVNPSIRTALKQEWSFQRVASSTDAATVTSILSIATISRGSA